MADKESERKVKGQVKWIRGCQGYGTIRVETFKG